MLKELFTITLFLILLLPTINAQRVELNATLLEKEVFQGDSLDVAISITNEGESVANITLNYWVWDDNKQWYSGKKEFILSPGGTRHLNKKVFIYPTQPPGIYKITFNVTSDTDQVDRTYSFSVVEKVERVVSEELLESEEIDVTLESNTIETWVGGREKLFLMISNNLGNTLTNIRITVKGIPSSWFRLSKQDIESLEAYKNAYILFTLMVPAKASAGDYTAVISVATPNSIEEKRLNIKVYENEQALLSSKLSFLEEKLDELKDEISNRNLQSEKITAMIQNIELALKFAKLHLESENYEEVKRSTMNTLRMMDVVEDEMELAELESNKRILPTLTVLIVVAIILSSGLVVLFVMLHYKKITINKFLKVPFLEAKELAETIKTEEKRESEEELREKKRKITNLLRILEKQKKEGIISERAYREMRKRNEEKLREIEKKLAELQRTT
jgi:hypothetical protein